MLWNRGIAKLLMLIICIALLGMQFSYAEAKGIDLTPEELAFIKEHPVIYLGVDPAFLPYEFFDKDGIYKGIAAEYLDLISERTGIQFDIAKGLTWSEAYEKAVVRELDGLPCVSLTKDRQKYFIFSDPYYSFQRVVFVSKGNPEIKSLPDLIKGRVAVQKNSSHHGYLKDLGVTDLGLYDTVEEALKAVSTGQEIGFVGNLATSSYLMKTEGITNLEYFTIASEQKQYLYFAARRDWPILIEIINKALASITTQEKIEIDNKWLGRENKLDYTGIIQVVMLITAVFSVVFIVSIYWIRRLNKEVMRRRETEMELVVAKEEAVMANQIKSTFLARMSHEVRTPLNAIMGMTYILKRTELNTSQAVYLDKITHATKDMLNIINDILDFSKIEAGKIDLERISFSMDEVIEHIISMVSLKIEEQKIEFSLHNDPNLPTFFWGDPKRIEQILLNLLSNALKFTHDGAVSLSIRMVARVKNAYTIEFSIADTGIGISQEQLSNLFTPFKQADSTITRRFGGTGLGLSICKHLVELMNGTMTVYSEVGEGSTFIMQLTLEEDRNMKYEERKKSASIYFQNIRVLVLEKSLFYTTLLKEYLNAFNIVAEFVQSDESAIQLIRESNSAGSKPYNLLIVDQDTPSGGGRGFMRRLQSVNAVHEPPRSILLIPASQEELYNQLEAAGFDIGISKPIIPSLLYNGILEIFKLNVLSIHEEEALEKRREVQSVDYPYHLLIVEDNKTNQFIAQSILEQAGFKITLADDGKQGVALFENKHDSIDMILMDLHMPIMNGYEATKRIREQDKNIPIIAMSADAIAGVEMKCKEEGFTDYISKPFDPDLFVQRLLPYLPIVNGKDTPLKPIGERPLGAELSLSDEGERLVLDPAEGIRSIGGNEALYRMVLMEYLAENQEIPGQLMSLLEGSHYGEVREMIHKIKSSSGSIGAKSFYNKTIEAQKVLQGEDHAAIQPLMRELVDDLSALLKAIAAYLTIRGD